MIINNIRILLMLDLSHRERKAIFMASLGSMLEFYDFIVFGFMASFLAKAILINYSQNSKIIILYTIFIIGYAVRPLGMYLYSKIAPVQSLRFIDLIITTLQVISTLIIGLTPDKSFSIIWWLPLLILSIARISQGIASGAEMQAELDHLKIKLPQNMAYAALGILAGNELGQFLAILVNRLINVIFNSHQVESYAWRLPFIFGSLLSIIIYWIRRKFAEQVNEEHCYRNIVPVYKLFSTYPVQTLIAIGLAGIRGAITFLYLIFIPFALHHFLNYDFLTISRFILLSTIVSITGAYLINQYSSFHKAQRNLLICMILLIPSILFWAYSFQHNTFVYIAILPIALISNCLTFLTQRVMAGFFPSHVRLAGMSFAHQQGYTICAGLMPLISIGIAHIILKENLHISHDSVFYSGTVFYLLVLITINIYGLRSWRNCTDYSDMIKLREFVLSKKSKIISKKVQD